MMKLDNQAKLQIAQKFYPDAKYKSGADVRLDHFNCVDVKFVVSEQRNLRPAIRVYITKRDKAVKDLYKDKLTAICKEIEGGFFVSQREKNDKYGTIDVCKQDTSTLVKAYEDIVKPGDQLAVWKCLYNAVISGIKDLTRADTSDNDMTTESLDGVSTNNEAESSESVDERNKILEFERQVGMKERNLIYFGAPGTGKSFKLNQKACRHKENGVDKVGAFDDENGTRYERVTFYPTYSYAQFVGTYKPVMKPIAEDPSKEEISYEFVPGPFLRVLVNALNDEENKDWCLIIEEINRANAAAVFGDVFQLLDRNSKGESEYSIAVSEDVKRYLSKNLNGTGKAVLGRMTGSEDMLKIPRNMYLWATMNSADQGVFPMDTAFKRRWEFEYVDKDEGSGYCSEWTVFGATDKRYFWDPIRKFLNGLLEKYGVNEDKLMGPFFVKPKAKDNQIDSKQFVSKVLMYLWEDAARMCRVKIFGDAINSYSQLVTEWSKQGLGIFESVVKQNDKGDPLNTLFQNDSQKFGDLNEGSNSPDAVVAGENGSQG